MKADYMPPWLGDFAIAEVLQVSPMDVQHLPLRWRYRAGVVIAARREQEELQKGKT